MDLGGFSGRAVSFATTTSTLLVALDVDFPSYCGCFLVDVVLLNLLLEALVLRFPSANFRKYLPNPFR